MANNKVLQAANKAKKDEFYTRLEDISAELKHYREWFKGKTVFCNCDDPYESNFFKFFALNFNAWKLKKLICTCWGGSTISQSEFVFDNIPVKVKTSGSDPKKRAYCLELTELKDMNGDGAENLEDVKILLSQHPPRELKGDPNYGAGDFRSQECVELLKEADVIVTNPPFSLFREYVKQLVKHKKKFLIIGNVNAITYKEIFPLIKENKIWLGVSIHSGDRMFYVPDYYTLNAAGCGIDESGRKFIRVKGVRWFTNIDHKKRHEPIDLFKKYSSDEYPKYDNYDAINIDTTSEIPMDYDGAMGVPITFLDKYCPDQFEILDPRDFTDSKKLQQKGYALIKDADGSINGVNKYARILIHRK